MISPLETLRTYTLGMRVEGVAELLDMPTYQYELAEEGREEIETHKLMPLQEFGINVNTLAKEQHEWMQWRGRVAA